MSVFERNRAGETAAASPGGAPRVEWVDIAKGWSIVLVVTMHSALGVGLALGETGWLHAVVAFAKPFRMPDFFVIAGLFVARAIDLPWRSYLDRKVVHFAYFYALWLAIVLAAKSGEMGFAAPWPFVRAYLWGFIEPFSTMWFIQLLPLLFLCDRLLRKVPLAATIIAGIALHLLAAAYPDGGEYAMSSVWTGWVTVDSFALFFIYFFIGANARDVLFRFAALAAANPIRTLFGLVFWGVLEAAAVRAGVAGVPGLTLILGFAGALAVVAMSSVLARFNLFGWLAYCGRRSLFVYLAFVLPMGAARIALTQTGLVKSVGWMSALVALFAIVFPLALERMTQGNWLSFLFRRPSWARLPGADDQTPTPAPTFAPAR